MNYSTLESPFIKQVIIRVTQLAVAKHFYTEVLGLELITESKAELQLGVDDNVLLIVRSGADFKKQRGKAGLYHFALLVPTREDLGGVLQHLLKMKAPIQGAADHIFSEAIYLQDPDGNGVEIYCDRPKDQWKVKEDGSLPLASDPLDAEGLLQVANQWEGMPIQTVMGHIHLHVASIRDSLHFYHKLLGFQIKIQMREQALFLASNEYHHHIGLNTWAGEGVPPNPENAAGLVSFVLQVEEERELSCIEKQLQADDYQYERSNRQLFVKDPSGNLIFINA
ncbi:glyoxalase [Halobacillus andaensis]|uniref:Glyoxalase n=1 Tax=Halobacillus andaensis TaxID=1176239 RepID=A0A917B701_HALAA|nr:VOC family protein [Halobacillus andaensis]MBP2006148.1 catechol 2,3-dioxygenase [Halobacillus andaensis]GGF23322.1 glyoxalase [Halobacillus andaensis]